MAAASGERVCVPAERWARLVMLGRPAARLFTTDTKAARIQAVLRHSVGALQCCIRQDSVKAPMREALEQETLPRAKPL